MVVTRQENRDAMVHCIQILALIETDPIALVIAQMATLILTRFMNMQDQLFRRFAYKEDPEAENAVPKNLQEA